MRANIGPVVLVAAALSIVALCAPCVGQDLTAGLRGHWTLDEASGTAIADSSGNAQHAAFGTGAPRWIASRPYGIALEFNGANDAVTHDGFAPPSEGIVAFRFRNEAVGGTQQTFGLVGWYKFDETSGTVAADSSGMGNDGTYAGGPALNVASNGNPAMGTAVDFNGSNYVQVPGLYGNPSSVSVAAWAKLDASDSNSAEIVSLGDHVILRLKNNSAELRYYNGSTWVGSSVARVIAQTGWHHYAAVFDETGDYKLYIDGNEAVAGALAGGISYSGLGANTRIGSHGNGQTTYDFDGRIDDVRIFKRPLTAEEVYQLYRRTRINGIKILQWVEAR